MSEEIQTEYDTEGVEKKFMFLNRKAPYGTIYALEMLETVLISAAFDQDVTLVFMDDGVYQLKKGCDTKAVNMKNFSATYKALGDYDISKLFVEKESMEARGLTLDDLIEVVFEDEDDDWAEKPAVHIKSRDEIAKLMEEQDVIISA
ncbi:MAG TPA: sulfurtransferase complex subunit TusC [Rhizobiales bacterium]|nr:sulfurtransferase complex subunit TusC [Hyphomicrobiales bacterium]